MLECQEMRMFSLMLLLIVVSSEPIDLCKTVVTFNTGLRKNVPNFKTRMNDQYKAILDLNADVVCLQEYWDNRYVGNLFFTMEKIYPHMMSSEFLPRWAGVPCSEDDMTYFNAVLRTCGCTDALKTSVIAGLLCLVKECKSNLKYRNYAQCLSCIAWTSTAPGSTLQDCTRSSYDINRMSGLGLVLLSKKPFLERNYWGFFPDNKMLLRRGYISATHPDFGKIYCANLSPPRGPYVEYDLNFNNYLEQQQAELALLLNGTDPTGHILMGDFNSGPHIMNRDPEKNLSFGDSTVYDLLIKQGYKAPYMKEDGRCTVCKSNPLVVNGANELSDHIFLKNRKYFGTLFQRVFHEKPLSDHYGVQAFLCKLL